MIKLLKRFVCKKKPVLTQITKDSNMRHGITAVIIHQFPKWVMGPLWDYRTLGPKIPQSQKLILKAYFIHICINTHINFGYISCKTMQKENAWSVFCMSLLLG